eukprot:scaffold102063_cov57-Phaeocystis_antarctica.AAC.1
MASTSTKPACLTSAELIPEMSTWQSTSSACTSASARTWTHYGCRLEAAGCRRDAHGLQAGCTHGAARLDGLLALGAVELADADPLLYAALAEAVHARCGDALVEVTEADRAAELLEGVGGDARDPHGSRPPLVRLRRGLLRAHLGYTWVTGCWVRFTGCAHGAVPCEAVVRDAEAVQAVLSSSVQAPCAVRVAATTARDGILVQQLAVPGWSTREASRSRVVVGAAHAALVAGPVIGAAHAAAAAAAAAPGAAPVLALVLP